MKANALRIRALYAVFFASGFCGLVYESLWTHYLKLIVGHAAYAQAVVLVVFIGGMALGAGLAGRYSERIGRPLLAYAVIEAMVALMALGFHGAFVQVSAWSTGWLLPTVCGPEGACHAMWGVAALLILLPSVLLGATFPLMCAGLIRLGVPAGRGLGLLYFSNSAGAALGVLCAGFVMVPQLGLPGTLLVAGMLNALVALGAWAASRGLSSRQSAPPSAPQPGAPTMLPWLLVAAATGLTSFIYEVAWIRMLTLVLGAATHSFELMLASFILGLALGGAWMRNRIGRMASPELSLARIQLAMGLLATATLPLYAGSFDAMALALRVLERTEQGYVLFNVTSALLAAAVMLPAAVCAGMTLPLVTAILLARGGGERQIGQVYGFNTLGAIGGVLLAVHGLIPLLGLKWSLATGALLDVALGAAILAWLTPASGENRRAWAAVAVAGAGCVGLALVAPFGPSQLASGVFRTGLASLQPDQRVLLHRDGKTATISVIENGAGIRTLATNGKPDGSSHPQGKGVTPDDPTVTLLAALGPAHHPQARQAAVIGLGTGITSAVLLESPALVALDTIEIEPAMVEAAQLFRPRNNAVFDDPRSRIVVDDARAWFARSDRRYDLIVSEPSNPWVSGVSGLFTEEFYRHVAGRLAPGGHFVQWLQVYESSPQLVDSVTRAFATAFPHFTAYAANPGDMLLVARQDGQPARLDAAAVAAMAGLQARLAQVGITSPAMLAAHRVGRSGEIRALAATWDAPANSDYWPYVDQRAFRDRFLGRSGAAAFELGLSPVPLLEFAEGAPPWLGQVHAAPIHAPPHVIAMARSRAALAWLFGIPGTQPPANAGDYELARNAITQCAFPTAGDPAWASLTQVAAAASRGLSPRDAQSLWQPATQPACWRTLAPVQAAWVDLFNAVAARDARAASANAARVLALDPRMPARAREYAVVAGASALLALEQPRAARAFLTREARPLPVDRLATPWLRYVMAQAAR